MVCTDLRACVNSVIEDQAKVISISGFHHILPSCNVNVAVDISVISIGNIK